MLGLRRKVYKIEKVCHLTLFSLEWKPTIGREKMGEKEKIM